MEGNRDQPFDSSLQPRRFVYRSAYPETNLVHPLRRATDTPHPCDEAPRHLHPKTQLLKFRVYPKLN